MSVDREAIFSALFARLQTVPGLVTCSRKWRPIDQVAAAEQPALFLTNGNERYKADREFPAVVTLMPTIYLYVRNDGDPDANGGEALHPILTAVEAALERTPTERNLAQVKFTPSAWGTTLGGLVSSVLIAGEIETDEGLLQNQAIAIIPLEIQTTA